MARWRTKSIFVVLTCLQVLIRVPETASERITKLEPEETLHNQVLRDRESAVFHLVNLKPGSDYELRVSYPATTPTNFLIQLMDQKSFHGKNSRKLMNIEKITFTSEQRVTEKLVQVTATRIGVPKDPQRLGDPVRYNIVLQELHFGLPGEVWKMGLLVVAIIVFVIKFASPRVLRLIEEEFTRTQKQNK